MKDTLKVEKKTLEFYFEIQNVQFNHRGKYFLKLTIQSSNAKNYKGITVKQTDGNVLGDNEVTTDMVHQSILNTTYHFENSKFLFTIPKGFCKNDANHDVYLLVEAFSCPEDTSQNGKKVGEAKFAIYPRSNAPRVNYNALPGENLYAASDVMTLFRTVSMAEIEMHCGRVQYTTFFREFVPVVQEPDEPKTLTTPRVSPSIRDTPAGHPDIPQTVRTPTPEMSLIPESPEPPAMDPKDKVTMSPAPADSRETVHPPLWNHVSQPGKEEVVVVVHAVVGLPVLPDGELPKPFVISECKLKNSSKKSKNYKCTQAAVQPTVSAVYEESLVLTYNDKDSTDSVLHMSVADQKTKQCLVTYSLPVTYLVPYHQYHLEMIKYVRSTVSGVIMYVTIIRKTSNLPWDLTSPNYLGLEVLLNGIKEKLNSPNIPMIAVARVVPDYYNYKHDILMKKLHPAGITLTTVAFPDPHPSTFTSPPQRSEGHPQMSLPGFPAEQPVWNHMFFFSHSRDNATLFTPGAAIVIEFYNTFMTTTHVTWKMQSPCAFATLLLDAQVYHQLSSDNAAMGLCLDGLPVQGNQLKTADNKTPTIGLYLRLLTNSQLNNRSVPTDLELIPKMDLAGINLNKDYYRSAPDILLLGESSKDENNQFDPEVELHPKYEDEGLLTPLPTRRQKLLYRTLYSPTEPLKDDEMPSHDAMESILPEYKYIFVDPDNKGQIKPGPSNAHKGAAQKDLDKTEASLLDHQMRELDRYRSAVHKMGQDILSLRQQLREISAENSRLRSDLGGYSNTRALLLEAPDLDGITKPELASKYIALKQKVSTQSIELKKYKERVQELQNELIKSNDREKEFVKVSTAHQSQQGILQKLQEKAQKVKNLESACKKQEKVIEKYEKMLRNTSPSNNNGANEALMDENRRLRAELAQAKDIQKKSGDGYADEAEKLELYERLDKAEGRIISLERQLDENARTWAREKSDLLLQLQEADHGLTQPPTFRTFPKATSHSFDPIADQPRRYSKLPSRNHTYPAPQRLDPISYS